MAWNEPGKDGGKDPWGGRGNDGPPDLDEALKKFQDLIGGIFGGSKNKPTKESPSGSGGASLGIILVLAVIVYSLFGIYQVNEQERAVTLRLGVYSETKGPGLHWNPPLIDSVIKVNATKVRLHSSVGEMLTQDLNIVEVNLSVQYRISDTRNFVLNVRNPENSLSQATDSALRHVVGSTKMHQVLTEGREKIAIEVQDRLQSYLDNYGTGILIGTVNVEGTAPPREVQAAFDDVNKAREDEERLKNEAETYANGIIPEARGQAQRVIEEANAYREQVVAQAEGEAQRFEQLLTEYEKAPKVTRERLYIDAIEDVMGKTAKVMVDVKGGNNMLYLPLDKLTSAAAAKPQNIELSQDMLREISRNVTQQLKREAAATSTRREIR